MGKPKWKHSKNEIADRIKYFLDQNHKDNLSENTKNHLVNIVMSGKCKINEDLLFDEDEYSANYRSGLIETLR